MPGPNTPADRFEYARAMQALIAAMEANEQATRDDERRVAGNQYLHALMEMVRWGHIVRLSEDRYQCGQQASGQVLLKVAHRRGAPSYRLEAHTAHQSGAILPEAIFTTDLATSPHEVSYRQYGTVQGDDGRWIPMPTGVTTLGRPGDPNGLAALVDALEMLPAAHPER